MSIFWKFSQPIGSEDLTEDPFEDKIVIDDSSNLGRRTFPGMTHQWVINSKWKNLSFPVKNPTSGLPSNYISRNTFAKIHIFYHKFKRQKKKIAILRKCFQTENILTNKPGRDPRTSLWTVYPICPKIRNATCAKNSEIFNF